MVEQQQMKKDLKVNISSTAWIRRLARPSFKRAGFWYEVLAWSRAG